jgi:hypothetical protein
MNNLIRARERLLSDIPAGDRKIANLFTVYNQSIPQRLYLPLMQWVVLAYGFALFGKDFPILIVEGKCLLPAT